MTVQNLKLRVPVKFPSQVNGGGGISVSKSNGIWSVQLGFSSLSYLPAGDIPDPTKKYVVIWDPITGEYNSTSLADVVETATTTSITSTPYSLKSSDRVLLVNYAGAVTINLGTQTARSGNAVSIKDISGAASTNHITINPAGGGETIEGASSLAITADYGGYTLLPYSGGWLIKP